MPPSNGGPGGAGGPGPKIPLSAEHAGRFSPVVRKIHEDGAAEGFRHARDLLFMKFEVFSKKMAPYAVLKLAVEMDRHALYCDMVAEKARGKADENLWEHYQKYLAGEVEVAPMAGANQPRRLKIGSVNVDVEADETSATEETD